MRVVLAYVGDGEGGAFDKNNCEDLACLRFFAERRAGLRWARVGEAGTLIPASTGRARRFSLATLIATRLNTAGQRGEAALRAELEQLAWIAPDWLETAA